MASTSTSVDAVIIGAGASGLTAAFHLQKAGVSVKILEAADRIGGRLHKNTSLAEFPIDIGGEWIHDYPDKILNPILDQNVASQVDTVKHDIKRMSIWNGSRFYTVAPTDFGRKDHKWVNSTWWDFFNNKVASTLQKDTIALNCHVSKVDYTDATTTVACKNGEAYQAKYVLVTVSMKLLQNKAISFVPNLPEKYTSAIAGYQMGSGLKVFMEFEGEPFYPLAFVVERDWKEYSVRMSSSNFAQRLFWDETYGQTTTRRILGMFAYGAMADKYAEILAKDNNEQALVDMLLAELDTIFDGKASKQYIQSVVQVWPHEPLVQTGYTRWVNNLTTSIPILQTPIDDKVFLAGEGIPADQRNWGYAHAAAMSGKEAARKIAEIKATGTFTPTVPASCCSIL